MYTTEDMELINNKTTCIKAPIVFKALVQGKFWSRLGKHLNDNWKKGWKKFWIYIDRAFGDFGRFLLSKYVKTSLDTIMFMTFQNQYTCNAKYITNELLKRKVSYRIVWAVTKDTDLSQFPEGIILVKRNSFEFFCEVASAKIWVDNAINFLWERVPKKRNQVYLQTWHGSLGLKRVGKDNVNNKRWLRSAKYCNLETNYCFSNSDFENEVFRSSHWPLERTEILQYGHARNDVLFNKDNSVTDDIRLKVCAFFNIDPTCKILLYAPTFRDKKSEQFYDIDYMLITKALNKRFGGEWVILERHHFHMRNDKKTGKAISDVKNVINATTYCDMQELLIAADIGLTDYSSWICDYVLSKNPAFLYATDLSNYNDERGFYYPLESAPFPIASNNEQLYKNILEFNNEIYQEKINKFLCDRGCIEDGKASERIVNKIIEIMEGKN